MINFGLSIEDLKPVQTEKCFLKSCDFSSNKFDETNDVGGKEDLDYGLINGGYAWRTSGFTPCSASCIGGKFCETKMFSRITLELNNIINLCD